MLNSIAVASAGLEFVTAARAIARCWGLPFVEGPAENSLCLVLGTQGLVLKQFGAGAPGPVTVDFVGGVVGHRRRFGGGRGQPIAKAAGLKPGQAPSIVDATAGLGRDAFVFASLGCKVTLLERSPIVAALLEDGLKRGAADPEIAPMIARMKLVYGDAATLLRDLRADVVYLDPMYPHRESSALVKKEMRIFQEFLGHDPDADRLLSAALEAARVRVVVKRPDYAEPLAGRKPTLRYDTKNHRFDVYVIKTLTS